MRRRPDVVKSGPQISSQRRPCGGVMTIEKIDPTQSLGLEAEWVGVLRSNRRQAYLVPYLDRRRWRVEIAQRDLAGAEDGEVVVAVPKASGRKRQRARQRVRGRVSERLGQPGDPGADFRALVWNHKLRVAFEPDVEAEVAALAPGLARRELRRRVDLRARPFLTIDPESARDHDDAVCLEQMGEQLCLWVAIADVSHYVPAGSALDREALRRGNSVYFPDRVVPMLPERISQDLCSLRAGCDRFVLVVEMRVDRAGRIVRSNFYPAVMRSRAGLGYLQAAAIMEGVMEGEPTAAASVEPEIAAQLQLLARLETRLARRRSEAGSIDFALSESEIELDASGRPARIAVRQRSCAHRAIEEAMLAANQAVSERLGKSGLGCIYRTHEAPEADDLEQLREQLQRFGLLDRGAARPLDSKQIQRALRRARGRPEASLVNLVALRTMKQARYSPGDRGHFALGFGSYLHFTSPIRRYADLVVHRILKHWLELGAEPLAGALDSQPQLDAIAVRISLRERIAIAAERDMVSLKKCVFMSAFVGQEFNGVISGVAPHGLYVTLDAHDVDGLVPSASLGEDLSLDERRHALVARRGGARYPLGAAMRIRVQEVDIVRGWIRFRPLRDAARPADGEAQPPPGERREDARGRERGVGVKRGRRPKQKVRRRGAPSRGRGRR